MKYAFITLALLAIVACERQLDPVKVEKKTPEATFVAEMVEKAQGDPSRLTTEERAKMDQITRGNTEMVIRSGAKKK
jgi:hypothetical protein